MINILNKLYENKEWIFGGIGITIILILTPFIKRFSLFLIDKFIMRSSNKLLNEAWTNLVKGHTYQAKIICEEVLSKYPNNKRAKIILKIVTQSKGKIQLCLRGQGSIELKEISEKDMKKVLDDFRKILDKENKKKNLK